MTQLKVTPVIKETLSKALENKKLTQEKRASLEAFLTKDEVPLLVLKELTEMTHLCLHELLAGSQIVPPRPDKAYIHDPEKEARKQKLRKAAEDRAYFAMVKDITVENPLADQKDKVEMRGALKDAAIPLNIILTTVGAFVFGYYFVNWMTHSFFQAMTGGTVLATGVFFVEIALFILRQQKEQRRYEGDDVASNKLLPFGLPGSEIRRKDKKD